MSVRLRILCVCRKSIQVRPDGILGVISKVNVAVLHCCSHFLIQWDMPRSTARWNMSRGRRRRTNQALWVRWVAAEGMPRSRARLTICAFQKRPAWWKIGAGYRLVPCMGGLSASACYLSPSSTIATVYQLDAGWSCTEYADEFLYIICLCVSTRCPICIDYKDSF